MENEEIKDKRRKELEKIISNLKAHNMDRRQIEKEINYTLNSLDVSVSRGGSDKLLTSLNMLLRIKELEKAISDQKKEPGSFSDTGQIKEVLDRIDKKVDNVNLVASSGLEHTLLNVSLSRTMLYHSAHLEAKQFGGEYSKIAADLFSVTEELYNKVRGVPPVDQKNKVA